MLNIADTLRRWCRGARPFALATVVDVRGSAPLPAGTSVAVDADGKGEPLEDPACTPGAISPAVTQANVKSTICRKGGYTSGIRPSTTVTGKEKTLNAASYGYKGPMGDAEYDHLISLQLGGDPNDPRNLWVEPPDPGHKRGGGVNNRKDPEETKLHTAVCAGKVSLTAAQKAIVTDWTTALSTLGLG
ncbi:XdhC family protein [Streptomyces sp. NBC_01549]|uniref:XdhC family protein n=1 Tax=unclassified Streptomyces TaxID=2593676 RepID=UPI0022591DE8|nr:XdhC family protein [Streptomyces sp. NBC_01549]MCX4597281.1 XdhC family protein [Streptomyces sp. NBC_01549]